MSAADRNSVSSVLAHEPVVKNHASVDAELPGSCLEHQPIRFAFTLDDVRMRRAEHDVDGVGMSGENRRQRIDDVLDALVWRQQPEGQDDRLPVQAEAVFAAAAGGNVRNAVRNQIDLIRGNAVHPLEQLGAGLAHHNQPLRQPRQLLEHQALRRIRFGQDRVQRRDDRHAQVPQQLEQMRARLAAEDPVFVLDRQHVHLVDVQKIRRAAIRGSGRLRRFRIGRARDTHGGGRRRSSRGRIRPRRAAASTNASVRCVVNVAMPQWRGR